MLEKFSIYLLGSFEQPKQCMLKPPSKTEYRVKQARAQAWARSSGTQTNCQAHTKWECFLALLVLGYMTFLLVAAPGFSITCSEILELSEAWVAFPLSKLLHFSVVSLRQMIFQDDRTFFSLKPSTECEQADTNSERRMTNIRNDKYWW